MRTLATRLSGRAYIFFSFLFLLESATFYVGNERMVLDVFWMEIVGFQVGTAFLVGPVKCAEPEMNSLA